jgi:hypothetical protein
MRWGRIILDEAHEIRNIKSKMNVSLSAMRSEIRWLLTGTPVFNTIKDFHWLVPISWVFPVKLFKVTSQMCASTYVQT